MSPSQVFSFSCQHLLHGNKHLFLTSFLFLIHHLQFSLSPLGLSLSPNSSFSSVATFWPLLCLPPSPFYPCPRSHPDSRAGPWQHRCGQSASRAHFQVDIPSARSPTVRLAKTKVWDLMKNLLAWMLPSPSLPLPRTSVSSAAPCAIQKSTTGTKAAGRGKLIPPFAFTECFLYISNLLPQKPPEPMPPSFARLLCRDLHPKFAM